MRESALRADQFTIGFGGTTRDDKEQLFRNRVAAARIFWPQKTAAHLAAEAGCSERAAKFYLAGQRDWSVAAVRALVSKVL